ncbi:MAG: hypothetical protein KJZ57_00105 [Anaerolineales bacterium]|jgi:hypothetical protein|nr:hypothetical protein [Anaerolineales bacterium]
MNLQEQGFRFVLRDGLGAWIHPADKRPGDLDCTDMSDDEFNAAYFFAANKDGEQE